MNQNAFSLVELSIVLVILGLLTGGILAGQNLIRAAELRSVITQYEQYRTAIHTFNGKYFALPGDMRNATDFWGVIGTGTCLTGSGTGTQTCNGDGDGIINGTNGGLAEANQFNERFMAWQHLANAGLIEGTYTGVAGSGGGSDAVIGINVPKSRISNGGWSFNYPGNASGSNMVFDGSYGNCLLVGGDPGGNNATFSPLFTPEETWNIDTKMDDGRPALGKIRVRDRVNCAVASDGAALTTSVGDAAKLDAKYNLTDTSPRCAPLMVNLF